MSSDKSIVISRKISNQSRQRLEEAGIEVTDVELVDISFRLQDEMFEIINKEAIPFVFTSKNGVKGILNLEAHNSSSLLSRDCYCIAPVTRDFALLSGFRPKGEGANATELAKCIAENGETKVLHSTAVNRREELYTQLAKSEVEIKPLVTYEKQIRTLRLKSSKMVMFFSPSQVDGYLKKTPLEPEVMAFCIGETTANYLKNKGHLNIKVSKKSTEKSLIDSVIRYSKKNG